VTPRLWGGGPRGGRHAGNGRTAGHEGIARTPAVTTQATAVGWWQGSKWNRRCTQMHADAPCGCNNCAPWRARRRCCASSGDVRRVVQVSRRATSERLGPMAALMTPAPGTSLSSLRPLAFGDRVRVYSTHRPPEIAAIVDGSCNIEPNGRVGGVDHGLGRDSQRFRGGDCRAPIARWVRRDGCPVGLCEGPRDEMRHGGGLACLLFRPV